MDKKKSSKKGSQKSNASKRTANAPGGHVPSADVHVGASTNQEQDVKRRLGSFETTGEHARTGNRGHS